MAAYTEDCYDEGNGPMMHLRHGIDLNELRNGEGSFFELGDLDTNDMPAEGANYFESSEAYKFRDPVTQDLDNESGEEDDGTTPFVRLQSKMADISPDGKGGVYKMVIQPGTGQKVPQDALVTIHYTASLEYSDEPYDSSRLRDKACTFPLGQGELFLGLDIAVATMRTGEIAKFLISPQYAFGALGCPPRIPAAATLLFQIDFIKFVEYNGVEKYKRMTVAEKREAGFKLISTVAKKNKEDGRDQFKEKRFAQAATCYNRAIRALEECHLADETEEIEQQKMLLRLYLDGAVCNLKMAQSGKVISLCNSALALRDSCVKALYLKGKALHQLGEFSRAKTCLLRAQRLEPQEADVNRELRNLEQDVQSFQAMEKNVCRRMFAPLLDANDNADSRSSAAASAKRLSGCSEEFKQIIEERLQSFKDNHDMMELPMPNCNFTSEELDCIAALAEKLGLDIVQKGEGSNLHVRIVKPGPEYIDEYPPLPTITKSSAK